MEGLFFRDLSRSFFIKVFGLAVTFGVQIFISRALGIDNYGVWYKAVSWMQIIVVVSAAGNVKKLLRDASADKANAFKQYLSILFQVVLTYFVLYLFYYFIMNTSGWIDSHELNTAIIIALFWGAFTIQNKFGTVMLQAVHKNYLTITLTRIVVPVAKASSIGILVLIIGDNIQILAGFPIAELIAFLLFLYLITLNYKPKSWKFKPRFSFNKDFWINDISKTLSPFINIAILSLLLANDQIGGYSASFKISEFLMFFTTIFISYSPVIVRYIKGDNLKALQESYTTISKVLLVVVFPFFLMLFAFSSHLLSLFGQGFPEFAIVLSILIIGVYFDAVTGPIGEILNMSGNEKTEMMINFTSITVNIILLYVLTKYYGILGAALAFALPRAVANLSKLILVRNLIGINTLTIEHLKILGMQLFFVLVISFITQFTLLIGVYSVMILSYFLVIYQLKWLNKAELRSFKRL